MGHVHDRPAKHEDRTPAGSPQEVGAFYERHPYPPPVDDLEGYRQIVEDRAAPRRACLFWPGEPYRDDRSILVAGCGTSQAAKYALRWPRGEGDRHRRQRDERRSTPKR